MIFTHSFLIIAFMQQGCHSWLVYGFRCERSQARFEVTSHSYLDFFPFHVTLIGFKHPSKRSADGDKNGRTVCSLEY